MGSCKDGCGSDQAFVRAHGPKRAQPHQVHYALCRAESLKHGPGPRAIASKLNFTKFNMLCRVVSYCAFSKRMRPMPDPRFRAHAGPFFFLARTEIFLDGLGRASGWTGPHPLGLRTHLPKTKTLSYLIFR